MKERPIIFSAPMVRAILAGTKVQTRRVVKPEPAGSVTTIYRPFASEPNNWQGYADNVGFIRWYGGCPYGQPGDRLWVREAWRTDDSGDDHRAPGTLSPIYTRLCYPATDQRGSALMGKLRPSTQMPRWASRITLEVTAIRVERLQDISDADAMAEGIPHHHDLVDCRRERYRALWEQINGPGAWDANPWVWVIEFKRVTP